MADDKASAKFDKYPSNTVSNYVTRANPASRPGRRGRGGITTYVYYFGTITDRPGAKMTPRQMARKSGNSAISE